VHRLVHLAVTLVCLAVLFCGVRYAIARERLRQTDVHSVYEQVNRESFNGSLPDAFVRWSYLEDKYGEVHFYADGSNVIEIDRASVTSEKQLLKTIRHESCHVETHTIVEETGQDVHGEAFQTCMKRFEEK